jgi:hypothetical protein
MATFKEFNLNLGSLTAGVAKKILFPFEDITKADVKDAQGTCGCTSVKITDEGISATYTPAVGHSGKSISVTLDPIKFNGFNDNGTPKNKVALNFYGDIK